MSDYVLHEGDCLAVMKTLADNSIDAVVTDPPYHLTSMVKRLSATTADEVEKNFTKTIAGQKTNPHAAMARGFMGKQWDGGDIAFRVELWSEVLRVLKPGGHVAAFSGTRTYHRMACAIEDAGFEIRDQLAWVYGSGFPKSHDVSKGIDKAAGHWRGRAGEVIDRTVGQVAKGTEYERADKGEPITDAAKQWQGWGSALKPAWECIALARKSLSEPTIAANVLRWGTGAINVDACRVSTNGESFHAPQSNPENRTGVVGIAMQATGDVARNHAAQRASIERTATLGRWPANLCHDGSQEVLDLFPEGGGGRFSKSGHRIGGKSENCVGLNGSKNAPDNYGDSGSAARYFYCAKASRADRAGSKHPTVKPVKLMQWLCRLITPPGGTILDPFAGSGTTGMAARQEGFPVVLIEREAEYITDIRRRMGDSADLMVAAE